ncbi:hypothetical protein Spith_0078 [Spirochaeta thermophila DSM 6578]|uniref:Mannanase galactose-binding domain-containing protein n=1 Tax=Winmispira thermophila (strain ATCC 700085 / DSM 6578 / Z-1203) TaxID=869211 RepID=G0GBK6_WINT7|nr:hypothetical protein [Spirochaeta thermophila]AEJ60365.1 hypothetical protein Spith_0078 [Spirochaeta thermophila DSM 6578]
MQRIMMIAGVLVLLVAGCTSAPQPAQDAGMAQAQQSMVVWEDFETKPFWFAVANAWNDDDSSLETRWNRQEATHGTASLEGVFRMNGKNGATFYTEEPEMNDFSPYKNLVVDFVNKSDKDLEVALVLCTGADWVWHESATVVLAPGENRDVYFDLTGSNWKCAASNWQFTAQVADIQSVRRVAFKFWGPEGLESSVLVDNVRLEKK